MDQLTSYLIGSLMDFALFPFTSGTWFVTIPFSFLSIGCCFGLIKRLMGGGL